MNKKLSLPTILLLAVAFCISSAFGAPTQPQPNAILTTDGTVFYPVRFVAAAFGADMQVDTGTGAITIAGVHNKIIFTPNQTDIRVGDRAVQLSPPPFARNGVTYLQAQILIEGAGTAGTRQPARHGEHATHLYLSAAVGKSSPTEGYRQAPA